MLAEKAQELDSLRGRRAELRTELDAIGHRITQLVAELVREIRDVATRTVKFHVSRLLKKYAAQSRHDL